MKENVDTRTKRKYSRRCNHCNQPYEGRGQYFCSISCSMSARDQRGKRPSFGHRGKSHTIESKLRISEARKGKATRDENPRWSGGRRITKSGYRTILVGGVHVLEHRLVYALTHGVDLGRNDCIHHKDHNKLNNNISNLELIDRSEHSRLHKKGVI